MRVDETTGALLGLDCEAWEAEATVLDAEYEAGTRKPGGQRTALRPATPPRPGPQAIAGASGSLASAASMSDSENSGSSSVPARNAS